MHGSSKMSVQVTVHGKPSMPEVITSHKSCVTIFRHEEICKCEKTGILFDEEISKCEQTGILFDIKLAFQTKEG